MAKRKGTSWKVSTESVQGEGSWVELRGVTVGEQKAARAGQLDDDQVIIEHVIGWNWADEAGRPLPLPKDEPGIVDTLTSEEARVLVFRIFSGDPEFDPNA